MFTKRARILVTGLFVVLLSVVLYMHIYPLAAVCVMFIVLLVWGYFKQGPIVLAAKHFHNKDYRGAERLLNEVGRPEWLSKRRRGFYEFIYGGICLQKKEYEAAERHYEIAAQFPLRSANDHVAALVHVANINVRNGNYEKARAYLQLTEKHKDNITAKMKDVIERVEQELRKH
ncbi:tetratricopeptide repeat protein [Mucilaginibacter sp. ZT4R22]|uniref:Tetratricopeptide repeat protein n=1 Tax=Mucilaginibacter pankratovii TaxID=2772110 RepID=A0ABR7WUZ9_9SPHI|nr:tetratricopeptide repeat protein [Mucilaginibacter pankratovii]MBD1366131.1 tetratricopeptide repeat protein [Mucilaginibacter pankratovii]